MTRYDRQALAALGGLFGFSGLLWLFSWFCREADDALEGIES